MPDEETEQQDQSVEQVATDDEAREHLGDKGKQALDRMKAERDQAIRQAKANADAAKRLAEIEDANKSEAQRQADQLTAARQELAQARAEGLRLRVAAKFGIGEEDADLFLTGSDEESLTRQAERLRARDVERQTAEVERAKNGPLVPREGHGVNTNDKDTEALSVLGFG